MFNILSIEVDISCGLPCFEIVGLPDTSIKEAKERVKTAIRNTGVEFLSRRILVNLAPANTRKEGSIFDLPIAVGILIATKNIVNEKLDELFDYVLNVPHVHELLSPIMAIVPLQLLAYHIAEFLGKDVDQPRNLAKSVTVE